MSKLIKERWMKLAGLILENDDLEMTEEIPDDLSSEWHFDSASSKEAEEAGWDPANADEWLAEELKSWHSKGSYEQV